MLFLHLFLREKLLFLFYIFNYIAIRLQKLWLVVLAKVTCYCSIWHQLLLITGVLLHRHHHIVKSLIYLVAILVVF